MRIQYGFTNDGLVVSKIRDKKENYYLAWPILDWENMKPENNFQMSYFLEKVKIEEVLSELQFVTWTRKIPMKIKNIHRKFWNMAPLTRV